MNDKKVIFLNNPAATCGGALTILKQYISEVAKNLEKNVITYVFCTVDLSEYECENVKIIKDIKAKRGTERIVWDLYGLKKWSKENRIKPDLLVSLQNTAIKGFQKVPQIVYLHQSIPYYTNIKWDIRKKEQRVYWFYRHIYKLIVGMSLKNNYVVVQTNWMKDAVINSHNINSNKVLVVKPTVNLKSSEIIDLNIDKNMLFYPASNQFYKNHITLIKALNIIVNEKKLVDIKLYLTIDNISMLNDECKENIRRFNLENNIVFLGHLKTEELISYYLKSNIVLFPSYIETVGLPLIEAKNLNKKIVVANLEYSKEVLSKYINVKFIEYKDYRKWANEILEFMRKKELDYKSVIEGDETSWKKLKEFIMTV